MQQLYTTEELLNKLYSELESKITKKKFILKKPLVSIMNKKTYIKNFEELCVILRCDDLHLKNFLKKELNTELSVNENNMLILDTVRSSSLVENAFAKYAGKFVICLEPKCGSGDTEIIKENRILYLCCKSCNSKKSIDDTYIKK